MICCIVQWFYIHIFVHVPNKICYENDVIAMIIIYAGCEIGSSVSLVVIDDKS